MKFEITSLLCGILATAVVNGYEIAPITQEMKSASEQIISYFLPPSGVTQTSSVAWSRLAYICDTFGPRFSGSEALETALDYIRDTAREDGLRVTEQFTMVPKWVRGEEWAEMLSPRRKKLHMVGLGMSNSTLGKNITGNVFVVADNEDLQANCSKAVGKIVLFNTIFTTYGNTVPSRTNAAVWAASCNATAALIRSIGPYSMQNPHTGYSIPWTIPAAAVSLEDASQMQRMQDRGQEVIVSLYMENQVYPDSQSRNLLIDLVGSERPDEYVLVSGHGDSWDTAEGAMDDGGGFMTSWEAVRVMKMLGLQPKRTIRAVVWVNEENGDAGGIQYLEDGLLNNTLVNHSIAIETDEGVFEPLGLSISCANTSNGGCGLAIEQLEVLSPLLDSIGGGRVSTGGGGADIDPICQTGIVCSGWNVLDPRLSNDVSNNPCTVDSMGKWEAPVFDPSTTSEYDSGYFWFHHSEADTMDRLDPTQVNTNAAALAIWTFAIAELPELLPRNEPATASKNDDSSDGGFFSHIDKVLLYVVVPITVVAFAIIIVGYKSKYLDSSINKANRKDHHDALLQDYYA
jgi:carboxypeptidase Q